MLGTVHCLDDNVASEFVSGTMAATAVSRVEGHLASCRDCRALVAALAGADEHDSNAATRRHEKVSEDSQVGKRPVLSIGDRVGRYLVLATLGAGGMGVVFTAYDPQLDRKVALKLLRANLGANTKEARTRLKREAQAIAQLNHPNVVGVYDVGTTPDGDVYIAMEFVEGDTLTTWLKKWPRTWREILDVFHQAGRGLMAAHSVGLLHRDFKPDNVLVGADGRVRVTDFGLARSLFLDDSARGPTTVKPAAEGSPLQVDLTATGTVLGTPRYMPPEQLTGPTIDARADQFSFCVALYEALYAAHPLEGGTSVSMLEKGLPANPPPEKSLVPAPIARAVMRGLDKERHKRYPTMAALIHDLAPPQQRSSVKFVALAAIGALAVTAATAAVISLKKPDAITRIAADDGPVIENLMREIKLRDKQISDLRHELSNKVDAKRLEEIQQQLDEKTEEVRFLTEQLIVEKAKKTPNAKPIVAQITGEQITGAIQNETVMRDLRFCFNEISLGGTQKAPRADKIDAVVRLTTKPNGTVMANSMSTAGLDFSPTTQLCVQGVLERVGYPNGSELTDVRVTLAWDTGTLAVAANVLRQREPAGSNLDGI
jgi:serine/threonine protein kinase